MVFPSTQVEFKAARLPWLSAGLAFVSLWVLLAIPAPQSFEAANPKAALKTAFRYWQAHGYLTANDPVLATARSHFDQRSPSFAIAVIRELGRRGMPERESEQDVEQATLDELSRVAQLEPNSINPLAKTHPFRVYGFTPASPSALTAVTHVFLHAGWIHFLAIVPLWFFLGASAEERFGAPRLALFTLSAAAASAAVHCLLEPDSRMSLIGAAGPTAALLSVFFLRHRMQPVRLVALAPRRDGSSRLKLVPFMIPAVAIPACWLVVNLCLTLWLDWIGVRNDLSLSAVAGGLGFGALAGLAWQRLGLDDAAPNPAPAPDLKSNVSFSDDQRATPEQSSPPIEEQIRDLIRRGELSQAADLWCDAVDQLPTPRLPSHDLVRLVSPLLASQHTQIAVAALRACVDATSGEMSIGLALQVLDLADGLDAATTLLAARRVLELPELHESKRKRILALVGELDPAQAAAPESTPEASFYADVPDLSSLPRFDAIQPVAAVPTRLSDEALYLRLDDGRKAKVAYPQIQALAVAALRDLSSKPVVVIDLLLNWTELSDAPLRTIRLRSDQFDPARLITPTGSPTENLRAFLAELRDRSGALPLPDADAVRGRPFRAFRFLRGYQRRVLKVDC